MRALLPTDTATADAPVNIHEFFARDWLAQGGVRANFIASVDGAISVDGVSRGLQTAGDNQIFAALRDLADVVLVGAGTVRAERYSAMRQSAARIQKRQEFGLAADLPLAVVSRRLDLDPGSALFTRAPAGARTLVFTCAAADATARHMIEPLADVVICGDTDVRLDRVVQALNERGHRRILCEGGPTLFGTLVGQGLVDELCLTISPMLAGPGPQRITGGSSWPSTHGLQLSGLLEEDGALFCRYRSV